MEISILLSYYTKNITNVNTLFEYLYIDDTLYNFFIS